MSGVIRPKYLQQARKSKTLNKPRFYRIAKYLQRQCFQINNLKIKIIFFGIVSRIIHVLKKDALRRYEIVTNEKEMFHKSTDLTL